MDWKARAEKRIKERKEYVESLKKAGKTRKLLLFYLPDCFDAIAAQMSAELAKCEYRTELSCNHSMMSATISKDAYPRASLTMQIAPPARPDSVDAMIVCATKGLGVNNDADQVTERYGISIDDGGNVTYRELSPAGGKRQHLTLDELVDAILTPFADCIAS